MIWLIVLPLHLVGVAGLSFKFSAIKLKLEKYEREICACGEMRNRFHEKYPPPGELSGWFWLLAGLPGSTLDPILRQHPEFEELRKKGIYFYRAYLLTLAAFLIYFVWLF